jgi:hypothetical protein
VFRPVVGQTSCPLDAGAGRGGGGHPRGARADRASLGVNQFRQIQRLVDRSTSPRRFTVWMLTAFAAFALVLASLGIYALISYR